VSGLPPPARELRVCVVVPARDEEALVSRCIDALAGQREVARGEFEILLVLDACCDDTGGRARAAAARHPGTVLHLLDGGGRGAGAARRAGMETACRRFEALGRPDGLIASTDADSVPDPDWIARQLDALAAGAAAVGGLIVLDGDGGLPAEARAARERRGARRSALLRRDDADAAHGFFGGASLALTAEAYRLAGGLEDRAALEDQALEAALTRRGVAIARPAAVRVRTSARTTGRAARGLAADLRIDAWRARRRYRAADFTLERLLRAKRETVSVVLPAREVAEEIGPILDALDPLARAGLIDELLVVDAGSRDGTAEVAAARGARVAHESELMPHLGPALGKGDAMWRALAATGGDIVCYLDADTEGFGAGFALGMLGPLLVDPDVQLVKGAFRRPFRADGVLVPDGGGRVTELMARPLLSLVAPDLGGFEQPLAGETAARRPLLESLPFPVGYGVETAILIDALAACGLDGLAQVDLGRRLNRHQPLRELSAMALAVLCAGLRRGLAPEALAAMAPGRMLLAAADGGEPELRDVPIAERPPMRRARAAAVG
jgi:glycosyltransferase involved in cell wall biosynthesis